MPIGRFVFIVSIKSHSTLSSVVIICTSFFEQWFSGRIGEFGRIRSALYLLTMSAWSGEKRSSLNLRAILCSSGVISRGSFTLSIENSCCILEDGISCLFSNIKCSRTLSVKVILLKLIFKLSTGWQFVVQFLLREWWLWRNLIGRAIQDMIAEIILRLSKAKELFIRFWPITSLEFSFPDRIVITRELVITATAGLSTVFTVTILECCLFNKVFWNLSIEATTNSSS